MPIASRPTWNVFIATLTLSVLLHGVLFLYFSIGRTEEQPQVRVIAKVDVIDSLKVPPRQVATPRPRIAIPKVAPLPQRQVPRPGHKGTRPGTGGDPAPAPKALRMNLPQSSSNRTVNPNSRVLQGRSTEGDPDRGNAFGDPNGVHGGTGTGGNGPGGTGGEGDGGFQMTSSTSPEDILRAGVIQCNGCHVEGNLGPAATRPINVETMAESTGWNIGYAPQSRYAIPVEFEFQLDADGKVLSIRILKTAQDPVLQEALKYFAEIHQWTPPNPRAPCYAVAIYNFYPPGNLR